MGERRPPAWRRAATWGVGCLALGLLTNFAMCWAMAFQPWDTPSSRRTGGTDDVVTWMGNRIDHPAKTLFGLAYMTPPTAVSQGDAVPLETLAPRWAGDVSPSAELVAGSRRAETMLICAFGWPLRSLSYTHRSATYADGPMVVTSGGLALPIEKRWGDDRVHLPVRPIWLGLLADATVFAVLWWIALRLASRYVVEGGSRGEPQQGRAGAVLTAMRPVRRLLLVGLAVGVVATPAVAWTCRLVGSPAVTNLAGTESDVAWFERHYGAPSDAWAVKRSYGWGDVRVILVDGTARVAERRLVGWPAPAFEAGWITRSDEAPRAVTGFRASPMRTPWPTTPLWTGVAIDVVFWGATGIVVLFTLPVARRYARIRRGLCPACGYCVGSADRCPECGRGLTR